MLPLWPVAGRRPPTGLSPRLRVRWSAPQAAGTSAQDAPAAQQSAPAPPSDGSGPADLCDFLEKEIPALEATGSPLEALTKLSADRLQFFLDTGREMSTMADMDAETSAACPDLRTRATELAGLQSFGEL